MDQNNPQAVVSEWTMSISVWMLVLCFGVRSSELLPVKMYLLYECGIRTYSIVLLPGTIAIQHLVIELMECKISKIRNSGRLNGYKFAGLLHVVF